MGALSPPFVNRGFADQWWNNAIPVVSALPFRAPMLGCMRFPSIELMGIKKSQPYMVIRPHIRRDTGRWSSKIPSDQQIVVESRAIGGSQEYIVQMNLCCAAGYHGATYSPEGTISTK